MVTTTANIASVPGPFLTVSRSMGGTIFDVEKITSKSKKKKKTPVEIGMISVDGGTISSSTFVLESTGYGSVILEGIGKLNIDMSKADRVIEDKIRDLAEYTLSRGRELDWDVDKEIDSYKRTAIKKAWKMASSVSRMAAKAGVESSVTFYPMILKDGNSSFLDVYAVEVVVHGGAKPSHSTPSFTYFGPREVDDVLDFGDRDFFKNDEDAADYFKLVQAIRDPSSVKKSGKAVTVYTARPVKDRRIYDNAKGVPTGIFVTTSADRAEGFGRELGGTEGRDLWKIKISDKNLVRTLKTGRVSDYQVVGKGKVPVLDIERL